MEYHCFSKSKKIEDIVRYNLELGVNTFDHSDNYSNGKNGGLFGNAIFQVLLKREDIIISTKAGIRQFSINQQRGVL